jgi:hypothetical protein
MHKDKIVLLGGYGDHSIEGVPHQISVVISPIGELSFGLTNLQTGMQVAYFMVDAVAAVDLNDAQNSFYRGEFEAEMFEEDVE